MSSVNFTVERRRVLALVSTVAGDDCSDRYPSERHDQIKCNDETDSTSIRFVPSFALPTWIIKVDVFDVVRPRNPRGVVVWDADSANKVQAGIVSGVNRASYVVWARTDVAFPHVGV